jgi:hypothetical protein
VVNDAQPCNNSSTLITEIIPEESEYIEPPKKIRILFCGTHPN